ncbi:MAG: substrate-binding domain-containing protein [Lachnospiraceae bacterium]|nr:substrate-binding domain-containing protein [Lachnospiraceae bacterium]
MKRISNRPFIGAAIVFIAFIVIMLLQIGGDEANKDEETRVSMIVYGDDSERWENMRQGAALACQDKGADISLITMLSENDAAEQEEIIGREIEDGADALIIAACSSERIREYIDSNRIKIPIIFVETMEQLSGKIIDISSDDYRMGYELGKEMLDSESDIVTVAVISENTQRDSVALREKGFRDALSEGQTGKIINWSGNEYENLAGTRVFIQRSVVSEATDVIVTFDNSTTDALIDALSNLNMDRKVYSISTSNKAVYNLYNKDIKALMYPDEFSMGYLAAKYALDRKDAQKMYSGKEIEYRIVKKENMYDEDNQTLLFPFVN